MTKDEYFARTNACLGLVTMSNKIENEEGRQLLLRAAWHLASKKWRRVIEQIQKAHR